MAMAKMKLDAVISEAPYLEGDRIRVEVTVRDHGSGESWSLESDLSKGAGGLIGAQAALPFDVVKQAEDTLFVYLAQRDVAARLKFLREQMVHHAQGVTYRPLVGLRHTSGKPEYFLKS
jgi:hypothetical protein